MNIQNSIISEIFKDISFSQQEIDIIESKFEELDLKKGVTLLKVEETVINQYYVYDGCLRTYFIDDDG
jgi:CRP-like cAMP-binding protein